MSGSGFKTFNSGDVLTASDVQNYLMDQAVTQFATTAARDAAITSPFEGQFAYSLADDSYYVYSGSAWIPYNITWKSYTPTINNVTLGSGYTLSASYCQIGKLVQVNFYFALGSTSAVTGDVNFSLPLNQASSNRSGSAGVATVVDASPATRYAGTVLLSGTPGYAFIRVMNASGTYVTNTALSSSIPIATWATSDSISANVIYEAA